MLDRLSDRASRAFGSRAFFIGNTLWFVAWILINVDIVPGIRAFDPYPFNFLTMVVSLEAILLSILVLNAQNRSEKLDELRAEIDLNVNMIAESELTRVLRICIATAKKVGIDVDSDPEMQEMLEPTDIEEIEDEIERELAE